MSWWRRLFGQSDSGEEELPAETPGGLGTVETMDLEVGTILLDTGRAIRFRPSEIGEDLSRGARVSVGHIENREGASWAKAVQRSSQAYEPPPLDLPDPPKREPEVLDPKVVEERRRAYAEHLAHRRKLAMEKRTRWQNEVGNKSFSDRLTRLSEHLEEQSLGHVAEKISDLARPTIRVLALPDTQVSPDGSRFGGRPFMPISTVWPEIDGRPLAFLGQWKLEDVPRDELESLDLPASGHLLFFYDAKEQPWGFEPEDARGWKVLYVPEPSASQVHAPPAGLDDEARFGECALRFGSTLTIPSAFSDALGDFLQEEGDSDHYWELRAALESDELDVPAHQIGGWPSVIQSDMEIQCQLTSNGVRMGNDAEYQATYRPELEQGVEDWTLLFQIDSDEEGPDWMWGDLGMLYFWIRKTDLAAKDFSKVWMILQCT